MINKSKKEKLSQRRNLQNVLILAANFRMMWLVACSIILLCQSARSKEHFTKRKNEKYKRTKY